MTEEQIALRNAHRLIEGLSEENAKLQARVDAVQALIDAANRNYVKDTRTHFSSAAIAFVVGVDEGLKAAVDKFDAALNPKTPEVST